MQAWGITRAARSPTQEKGRRKTLPDKSHRRESTYAPRFDVGDAPVQESDRKFRAVGRRSICLLRGRCSKPARSPRQSGRRTRRRRARKESPNHTWPGAGLARPEGNFVAGESFRLVSVLVAHEVQVGAKPGSVVRDFFQVFGDGGELKPLVPGVAKANCQQSDFSGHRAFRRAN